MTRRDRRKERAHDRRLRARRDAYYPSDSTWKVFLCGLPEWLQEHVEVLRASGIPWGEIRAFKEAADHCSPTHKKLLTRMTSILGEDLEPYHGRTPDQLERLHGDENKEELNAFKRARVRLARLIQRARRVGLAPHPIVRRVPRGKGGRPPSWTRDREIVNTIRKHRKQGKRWEDIRRYLENHFRQFPKISRQRFHAAVRNLGLQ